MEVDIGRTSALACNDGERTAEYGMDEPGKVRSRCALWILGRVAEDPMEHGTWMDGVSCTRAVPRIRQA
jgi:hypothetical protein